MLNSLLSIQDFNVFGLDIIHVASFSELIFRFILNLTVVVYIVRYLYYPVTRRKDYLFSFLLISILVFLICFLLESVKLQIGFAFGLFAIFGILRYRTNAIPIKEMTYLFILLGISVINALVNKKTSWAELLFTNAALVIIIYGLERLWLLKHESSKNIIYERVDMNAPEKREELKKDLEARTGLKINRVEIGRIDYLRDTTRIIIYYYETHGKINMADESDRAYNRQADNDDDD
jgi:apolipoprotein N-acyltransferase